MAAGLFELRKDPITGWWVATVVDRAFHRDRFARAAEPIDDRLFGCANCSTPEGDGVRVRMLKDFAFHVVGTGDDARELDTRARPGGARAGARDGQLADDRRAARRASAAARGRQRDDRGARRRRARGARGGPQPGPDRLPPGRPELGRAGRRADQPPVPRPVRPAPDPAPDRRGDGRRGPLRHPRGRVPVLPPRPRRVAGSPTGSSGRTTSSVAFAPYASRSSFEVWIVPRRHEADFGRATVPDVAATVGGPPPGPRPAGGQPRRPALQPRPPHRAVARTGRRDVPLALGDPSRACARSPASNWGPACPVNPVSPEDAVEELLGRAERGADGTGLMRHTGEGRVVSLADEGRIRFDRAP